MQRNILKKYVMDFYQASILNLRIRSAAMPSQFGDLLYR